MLSYYECSSKYANKKIIDILNKYQCISLNLSRPLNEEELLLNFGILPGDNSLDEKELLKETQKFITYKTSFDKFLLSNLKFVVFIAKKFDYNIDLLDLINEGNIGLIKAIKKYDNSMGGFANYASWWIKSAIQQTYNSSKFSLNLSQHQIDALTDFKRRYIELTIKEGRKLETKEIAEKLSIPIEKAEKNFELMNSIVSLDAPIDELKEKNIGSLVISEEDTEQSAYNDSLNQELHLLFNEVLNENEIRIIKMKYGLDEYENNQIQIEKIAEELTLPKGKVKMMEQSALFKMRRHINTNNDNRCLREYLK